MLANAGRGFLTEHWRFANPRVGIAMNSLSRSLSLYRYTILYNICIIAFTNKRYLPVFLRRTEKKPYITKDIFWVVAFDHVCKNGQAPGLMRCHGRQFSDCWAASSNIISIWAPVGKETHRNMADSACLGPFMDHFESTCAVPRCLVRARSNRKGSKISRKLRS